MTSITSPSLEPTLGSHVRPQPGSDTCTLSLAAWVSAAPGRFSHVLESKLKVHLLDTLGCQVAFASLPWSRAASAHARASGAGPSTLVLSGHRAAPAAAAFANACAGHGFEMDDTEMRTASHPGVVIVPTVLAMAQVAGASGSEAVRAIGIGYEVMVRVGLAGIGMMARGFHTTGVAGAVGAAAAAAAVLGLDADGVRHALGIAASRAAGITEYAVSGGSVKRVHAGFAAQAGVEAAQLASLGITAPAAALEGGRGLLGAVDDAPEAGLLTEGLGERYELLTTGLKPYCCCAGQHAVLDAVARLQERVPDLDVDSVARVEVRQNAREAAVVGRIRRPQDVVSAQFSAAFGVAMRLTGRGNGFHDYASAPLEDARVSRVVDLVDYGIAEEPLDGHGPAVVTLELRDGSRYREAVAYPRGSAHRPLSDEEALEKFHALADDPLGPRRAASLAEAVMGLDGAADLDGLAGLLVAREGYVPPALQASG